MTPLKLNSKTKGKNSEDFACAYINSLGWRILKRNFFIRTSEADIIALDDLTLVAVEVKSIKNKNWEVSDISKQVSGIKLLKIKQALCAYASLFNTKFDNMRIDVVALYGGKLYHYKGV